MRTARRLCTVSFLLLALLAIDLPSASATALCEDKGLEGVCDYAYAAATSLSATATKATFTTPMGSIVCSSSLKSTLSEEPTGSKSNLNSAVTLTFSSCVLGGKTSCTAEAINAPYSGTFAWTSAYNGTLTLAESKEKGKLEIDVNCTLIHCKFTSEKMTTSVGGGGAGSATIVASEVPMSVSGAFCGTKGNTFTATYVFDSPNKGEVFVMAEWRPVRLCKVANESPCEAQFYPSATLLDAVTQGDQVFKLKYVDGGTDRETTATCGTSALAAASGRQGYPQRGSTTGTAFTFTCTALCTVIAGNLHWIWKLWALAGGKGELEFEAGTMGPPSMLIKCGTLECTYTAAKIPFIITNGAPAVMSVTTTSFGTKVSGGADCRGIVWQSGTYTFTKPEAGSPASPRMYVVQEGV